MKYQGERSKKFNHLLYELCTFYFKICQSFKIRRNRVSIKFNFIIFNASIKYIFNIPLFFKTEILF